MKHIRIFISLSLLLILSLLGLTGCGKKAPKTNVPFAEIAWDNSVDDVISNEKSEYTTYDSTYSGTTYTFPKNYIDLEGTVKYMFDDNDELMCIAWTYSSDTEEDLKNTYHQIHKLVEDTYGESEYDPKNQTSYGDVWYLESGDIILSMVNTDTQKALQYSYLNPKVSNTDLPK